MQGTFLCADDPTIKKKSLLSCNFIPVGREHNISIVNCILYNELSDGKCYAEDKKLGEE